MWKSELNDLRNRQSPPHDAVGGWRIRHEVHTRVKSTFAIERGCSPANECARKTTFRMLHRRQARLSALRSGAMTFASVREAALCAGGPPVPPGLSFSISGVGESAAVSDALTCASTSSRACEILELQEWGRWWRDGPGCGIRKNRDLHADRISGPDCPQLVQYSNIAYKRGSTGAFWPGSEDLQVILFRPFPPHCTSLRGEPRGEWIRGAHINNQATRRSLAENGSPD